MRIRLKTILLSLLTLVVLLVLGVITMVGWATVLGPKARPVTDRKFDVTDTRLARGKYLTEAVASCFHCHSEHDLTDPTYPVPAGKKGAGWAMPIPELGAVRAPNITSDPQTGIGAWSDDEIARAIQEGISKDGTALFPVMPYFNFRNLTDEDLASVVVYLRTIPPVKNAMPRTELIFPLKYILNTIPQPLTTRAPAPPRTTPEARGEYLVESVAGCGNCHTPAIQGEMIAGMTFGGGSMFHDPGQKMQPVFSANITFDPSGIAHYDDTLFIQTLRTGQMGGRTLNHIMPFSSFQVMTDDDLRDVFAYLKSKPHVKHRVSNTEPPTDCVLCKQKHGLGELNK